MQNKAFKTTKLMFFSYFFIFLKSLSNKFSGVVCLESKKIIDDTPRLQVDNNRKENVPNGSFWC